MACSGSEVALHPAVQSGAPVLQRQIGKNQSYSARITGEGGRLNLNWLVSGENPQRLELLRRFLESQGIDLNERDHMIDCLLDWVDPDNLVRLNGAETSENYKPANRLLTRMEDLKKVKGWGEFTSTPGWEDYFTVNSTGPVDIIWASRDILIALPGMNPDIVDRFLKLRSGEDGIDGTTDDPPFKSLEDVRRCSWLFSGPIQATCGAGKFQGSGAASCQRGEIGRCDARRANRVSQNRGRSSNNNVEGAVISRLPRPFSLFRGGRVGTSSGPLIPIKRGKCGHWHHLRMPSRFSRFRTS